jgi:hypothetical protein
MRLLAGLVNLFWIASTGARGWSGLMTVCDYQRLGRTAGQGRRARDIPGHGPTAAAAYPLRRRADTVNTGARLAPGWLHGRGHLAFLLATPFDAAPRYWGFGMHAPRLFTLSHAGESCCRLVWGAYSAQHHNTREPAPAGAAGASCHGGQVVSAPKSARAVAAL